MHSHDGHRAIELDDFSSLARSNSAEIVAGQERQPLIQRSSFSSSSSTPSRHSLRGTNSGANHISGQNRSNKLKDDEDSSFLVDFIMEKLKDSKIAHFANKIAVDHEPGLTTTQLMVRTPFISC